MVELNYYRKVEYAHYGQIILTMDLFVPKADHGAPVIVWLHQGGMGHRKFYVFGPPILEMLGYGYAVAQVTYRVTSDPCDDRTLVQFPAQLQDVKTAVRFLRANAEIYGLDPQRIGIAGDSAGGQLSALAALTSGLPQFEAGPFLGYSSDVKCACDFYGPTDYLSMSRHAMLSPVRNPDFDYDAPDSYEGLVCGGPIQENKEKARAASPISYVDKDAPKHIPLLIFHGDHDPNVPYLQSVTLYESMNEAGYDVEFHTMPGQGHSLDWFEDVKAAFIEFFEKHL